MVKIFFRKTVLSCICNTDNVISWRGFSTGGYSSQAGNFSISGEELGSQIGLCELRLVLFKILARQHFLTAAEEVWHMRRLLCIHTTQFQVNILVIFLDWHSAIWWKLVYEERKAENHCFWTVYFAVSNPFKILKYIAVVI